jgi:hypothetical protein
MKEIDLKVLNSKYIGFKVLEIIYDEHCDIHRKRKAKCLCECGIEFTARVDALKEKRGCRKCGCKHGGKQRILPNFKAALKAYYMSYYRNAKSRNLEFTLTNEEFDNIISKNCVYCGMSPQDQSYLSRSTKKYDKFYASGIDRLDNKLGYTVDNCVSCCTKCNMMKKTLGCDEFLQHINAIYEYQIFNVNNIIESNDERLL